MAGYQFELVDKNITKDKTFECVICHNLLKDAHETSCEHPFCKECLTTWEKTRNKQGLPECCPLCNERYDIDKVRRIGTINRIVKSQLQVYCQSNQEGCTWEGTIDSFEDHSKDHCIYTIIDCPNEGCDLTVSRHKMNQHTKENCNFRDITCEFCKEHQTFNNLEKHLEICLEAPIDCPNESCDVKLTRGKLEDHTARHCQFEVSFCPFVEVGCITKMERKKIEAHVSDHNKQHTNMLLQSYLTIKDILTDTKKELMDTKIKQENSEVEALKINDILTEVKKELTETKKELMETKEELKEIKIKQENSGEEAMKSVKILREFTVESLIQTMNYFETDVENYEGNFNRLVSIMETGEYYEIKDKVYVKICIDEFKRQGSIFRVYMARKTQFNGLKLEKNCIFSSKNVCLLEFFGRLEVYLLQPTNQWNFCNINLYFINPRKLMKVKYTTNSIFGCSSIDFGNFVFHGNCCFLIEISSV